MERINIGCGDVPTRGWLNYDNSLTVRLAGWPWLARLLGAAGLLSPKQLGFIAAVRREGVRYADAINAIPHADGTVEVLYTCHMLEHLDRDEARRFLAEARRVLISGGIIRIAVPDLRFHVESYLQDGLADRFIENLFMATPRTTSLPGKLRYLLIGERHHLWMYDGDSLTRLLRDAGFHAPRIMPAGETTIPDPGPLDLAERSPESVFIEAVNP
jgi:SAM-dependent methyltransferase